MRKLTVLITISLFLVSPVFAQVDTITPARITPASPLYFLKSVREILELKFAPTTHIRSLRELEFANRRIREVKSLVNSSHEELIQPALEKYWSGLGQMLGISDLRDENQAEEISSSINLHMRLLQEVFTEVSDSKAQRSIRATIYRLSEWDNRLISKLNTAEHPVFAKQILSSKLSGCRFLSKEASAAAATETEKHVLSERAQKCWEIKL